MASGLLFCAPEVGVCILVHEISEVPAVLGLLGIAEGMMIHHILLRCVNGQCVTWIQVWKGRIEWEEEKWT